MISLREFERLSKNRRFSLFVFAILSIVILATYLQGGNFQDLIDEELNTDGIDWRNISGILKIQKRLKCKPKRPPAKFLIVPSFYIACRKNSCFKNKKIKWKMVTFIKSRGNNFEKRINIRRTWGSVSYLNGGKFYLVFVIGIVDKMTQAFIDEENRRYGDILQINILDLYGTIAEKTLAGMQWAGRNLPDGFLYSSADDDVIVDWTALVDQINKYLKVANTLKWPEFPIVCMLSVRRNDSPIRQKKNKYYLPISQFRWPFLPKFCLGGMYTTSVRVAHQLWEASRSERSLLMDDVWITGILREKIKMPSQMVFSTHPPGAFHFHKKSGRKRKTSELWKKLSDNLSSTSVCYCR